MARPNTLKKVHGGVGLFAGRVSLTPKHVVPKLKQRSSLDESKKASESMANTLLAFSPKKQPKRRDSTNDSNHVSSGAPSEIKQTTAKRDQCPPKTLRQSRGGLLVQKASEQRTSHQVGPGACAAEVRHPQRPRGLSTDENVQPQPSPNTSSSRRPAERKDERSKEHRSGFKDPAEDPPKYVSVMQKRTRPFLQPPPPRQYGRSSLRHIVTPPHNTPAKRPRQEETVDLTAESDEEDDASPTPSRKDLLEVTGSISTGVDSSDLCLEPVVSASDGGDVEQSMSSEDQQCEFLRSWVGSDAIVVSQCHGGDGSDTVEKKGGSTVKAEGMGSFALDTSTLKCLDSNTWLNDEVINAVMAVLSLRSARNVQDDLPDDDEQEVMRSGRNGGYPRCAYFSSFFYAMLRNAKDGYSHENVKRWGRRKNLGACDRIFFPINVSNSHWCLAVVFPKEKCIKYFDSLGGRNSNCLNLLERKPSTPDFWVCALLWPFLGLGRAMAVTKRRILTFAACTGYMQDEGALRGEESLQGEWNKINVGPPEVPRQHDGSSCGVFACAYADCLSAGGQPSGFAQQNMMAIRRSMRQFLERCRM